MCILVSSNMYNQQVHYVGENKKNLETLAQRICLKYVQGGKFFENAKKKKPIG